MDLPTKILLVAAATLAPSLIATIGLKFAVPQDSNAAGWWMVRLLPWIAGLTVVAFFVSLLIAAGPKK
jgi:hypothetical protein